MNDEQVRTTIAVLKAYVDGSLSTDLCDELDEAIESAYIELVKNMPDPDPDDYPIVIVPEENIDDQIGWWEL